MLSPKIIALPVSPVRQGSAEGTDVRAISDVKALLLKARAVYRYIAEERMIGLSTDTGFEREGKATLEVPLADGTTMKIYPESYASFILFPLLTSFVMGRIVLLGDPGLGKTQIATLMGQIMGLTLSEIRAGMVHGHPQLTMADLFGNLDLAKYRDGEIVPVWRNMVRAIFRFIDEFNRIPTKTQSGLLTAVADQYVELFNQVLQMEDAPWYFTANEANGGGTYQVIAALWDRMDVSVRAVPINSHDLGRAREIDNKKEIPANLRMAPEEITVIRERIESLPVESDAENRLEYFFSQLNASEKAAEAVEHRFKSNMGEGGKRGDALWSGGHDDPQEYIGAQVENTVGTRIYQSVIKYARALAWFRGKESVEAEDLRAVLPAVMGHRIKPNRSAQAEDRWAWVEKMWQKAMDRYDERERDNSPGYQRLLVELEEISLGDKPGKILEYMKTFAQAADGSSGVEDLLAMKILYEETAREAEARGAMPSATPPAPPAPQPPRAPITASGGRVILTPEEAIIRMPPIGSFVRLAGGIFKMGSTEADDEKPVHEVEISSFLMSPHDVTNQEYKRFMDAGGYRNNSYWSAEGKSWRDSKSITMPENWTDTRFNQPKQPVVGASWFEAEAYLNWNGSRLPTEAEWEYAARGGLNGKKYPWGDEEPTGRAHFGQDGSTGAPVLIDAPGFAPNRFGLRHMAGNVWEWGADWYEANYYGTLRGRVKDPKGPASGSIRILRGGSWFNTAVSLRAAIRNRIVPDSRNYFIGFRAARTL